MDRYPEERSSLLESPLLRRDDPDGGAVELGRSRVVDGDRTSRRWPDGGRGADEGVRVVEPEETLPSVRLVSVRVEGVLLTSVVRLRPAAGAVTEPLVPPAVGKVTRSPVSRRTPPSLRRTPELRVVVEVYESRQPVVP